VSGSVIVSAAEIIRMLAPIEHAEQAQRTHASGHSEAGDDKFLAVRWDNFWNFLCFLESMAAVICLKARLSTLL